MPQTGQDGFGWRLRCYRLEVGLTQEELAEKSGLSVRAISDMESGRTSRPRRSSLDRIADALQISSTGRMELMNALRPVSLPPPLKQSDSVTKQQPSATDPGSMVPRQLPSVAAHFVGRVAELKELDELLDRADAEKAGTVVVAAIVGTAGVGKSALAIRWAHQVAEHFPDGQLYVNLRGYDPAQPMTAADALAAFLRALGVPGRDIPPEVGERAALYRSLISGRRILLVADNTGSVEQVRPLLPASSRCTAIVTSRDALVGLVAREGARRLHLHQLPIAETHDLLKALIGDRVDADPAAAAALANHCSRLPLALRVAAELAVSRPATMLADLVSELADQKRRLDLLHADGDPQTAVRAVFSWSYRVLDADARRAFRLIGVNPSHDLDCYAAAALTNMPARDASHLLDKLAHAHLIQTTGPGRFNMHDLLRAFAGELAAAHEDEDGQRAALTRLLDYYLHSAAAAMNTLYPGEHHRRPSIPPVTTPVPPVTEPAEAQAWLDAERANLVAVTAHAAGHGWAAHATRLATTLFRYLSTGSYAAEAITIYTHAREAARQAGDCAAEAAALNHSASVYWQQSRYQQATDHLQRALALSRQAGDRGREAGTLSSLGVICSTQGRYQEASTLIAQALDIYRQAGDLSGAMHCLVNLGNAEERQGRYQQAARHHQQSVAIARKLDDRFTQHAALINLGTVRMRLGDLQQAVSYLSQGLAFCRETNDRYRQADALTRIGDVRLRQGRIQEAVDRIQEALALYQEISDRSGEADALNSLGEALLAAGQPSRARTHHTAAGEIADDIGDSYQQARAHHGLARAHHALARPDKARDHWEKALAIYTHLRAPEADQVRTQLADASNHHRPER